MSEQMDEGSGIAGRAEREGRPPVPKRSARAASWAVFGVLWVAGLALGDQIEAAGHDFSGAWAVFYGGMWMLMCAEVRRALLVLWSDDDASAASRPRWVGVERKVRPVDGEDV